MTHWRETRFSGKALSLNIVILKILKLLLNVIYIHIYQEIIRKQKKILVL